MRLRSIDMQEWLWHFLGSFLFPDASGNTISWIFLDILCRPWENIAGYNWGNVSLHGHTNSYAKPAAVA
jgi:hypothetical protein